MPDLAISYTLAEAGRQFLQGALCLLLLSTPLLGMSLFLTHHLRRRGNFAAASTIQRLSLVGLIVGSLLFFCLPYAGNPFGRRATRTTPLPPPPRMSVVPVATPSMGTVGKIWIPVEQQTPAQPDFSRWYVSLALAWIAGSSVLLLGLALSYAYLARFWFQAHPLPPSSPVTQNFETLLAVSNWAPSRQAPILLTHSRVTIPFAAHLPLLPPAIFLPENPTSLLTEEALSAVLAHELSHLLRNDPAWNLLLRIAGAIFWLQPLIWRQLHQMSTIQELACDQTALHLTRGICRPHVFAASLVNLAERHLLPTWMLQATASMACYRPLIEERVRHILATGKASAPSATPPLSLPARIVLSAGATVALGLSLGSVARLNSAAALPDVPLPSFRGNLSAVPRLDLEYRNTPKLDVMQLAFHLSGLRSEVDPALLKSEEDFGYMSGGCHQVPLPQALTSLLRAASDSGKLRYRIDGKVAYIFPVAVGPDGLPSQRVTMNYGRNTPLNTALQDMFAQTGFQYTPRFFDPTITTHAQLNQASFRTALETLLRNASKPLTYRAYPDSGQIFISPIRPIRTVTSSIAPPLVLSGGYKADARLPDTLVTLELKGTPLRKALEKLFQKAHQNYSIKADMDSRPTYVTARWENESLRVILPAILHQTSFVYTVEKGVITIRPRPQQ